MIGTIRKFGGSGKVGCGTYLGNPPRDNAICHGGRLQPMIFEMLNEEKFLLPGQKDFLEWILADSA